MQNLFVLMEPSNHAWETSMKGGTMILNRFCIDEDAAFELSGVNYLKNRLLMWKTRKALSSKLKEKLKERSIHS